MHGDPTTIRKRYKYYPGTFGSNSNIYTDIACIGKPALSSQGKVYKIAVGRGDAKGSLLVEGSPSSSLSKLISSYSTAPLLKSHLNYINHPPPPAPTPSIVKDCPKSRRDLVMQDKWEETIMRK
ncbi:predicted protein [Sclerotinia sclerotiorum 1980 UF-70]|uniref:Uncharacterized protein n=1 Tax=Sclerotinia sclerotiorum (strain ATCC 18683 / 1980 / Ss-1) TaxID=665079 RepID=A7E832_SCLS1|nr:predicted protein [Sclerotinia sclerotiorum 1980 UF-70]EDN96534.1 predicted protein [Sclerotinia sclerotiorum 1980 UF-70]